MNFEQFIQQANYYGASRTPFVFLLDFEQQKPLIVPLQQAQQAGMAYDIMFDNQRLSNQHDFAEVKFCKAQPTNSPTNPLVFNAQPISFDSYRQAFDQVGQQLHFGNSYLLNLTFATPITINIDLAQIFANTTAKYKFWLKDHFVCFSPECFVEIKHNQISTFPMKGTISAEVENAESELLNSAKEMQEHYTIVDLLRNDLSIVATDVSVRKFRYVDTIDMQQGDTQKGKILQTSSHITGNLSDNWQAQIGTILSKLLPAGSICGAPKQKTAEIIRQVEGKPRGYYTGVFGLFLGESFTSAVAIRYIEQQGEQYYFRSGGGITTMSKAEEEYDELIKKVYLPIKGQANV